MDAELTDAVRAAIIDAFERHGQRYYEDFFAELRKGGPSAEETYRRVWAEQRFLERRARDPGVNQHVFRRTLGSAVVRKDQVRLVRAALLSIAAEARSTVRSLLAQQARQSESNAGEREGGHTRRHDQRFRNEVYPEVFFVPQEQNSAPTDARERPFSTVFAPRILPLREASEEAASYAEWDRGRVWSTPNVHDEIVRNALLREVQPAYWEALDRFRREAQSAIGRLLSTPGTDHEVSTFLAREFQDAPGLLQIFYNHITSMIALRWFRARRPDERARLLSAAFPFTYTMRDAGRALALCEGMMGSKEAAKSFLGLASSAALPSGLPKVSLVIERTLLKVGAENEVERAARWDNIGTALREMSSFQEARGAWKKAIELYRRRAEVYRELVARKNIAECDIREGHSDLGIQTMREIEKRVPDLTKAQERFGVLWNLASACRRSDLSWLEYQYLSRAFDEAEDTSVQIQISNRLIQLESVLDSKGF